LKTGLTVYLETKLNQIIFPFGKHKGEVLGDIPRGYLEWFADSSDKEGPLKFCVELYLELNPK